jgi:quercetin dioxygenase-like cupin family protein
MRKVESWNFDEIAPYADNVMGIAFRLPSEAATIIRTLMRSDAHVTEHTHSHDRFLIVFGGEMELVSDGTRYPLSKGMVLRIPAGTLHAADFRAGCDFMEIGCGVEPLDAAAAA